MREVNPKETTRAYAFEMWMQAPMPMVTLITALEVAHLLKISRELHHRRWRGDDGRCQLFLLGREALLSDRHKSLSQS